MILYFSGTGNSQLVAQRLALELDDDVQCINHHLKSGQSAAIDSARPLILVTPTYSWRLPRVVAQWLEQTSFTGDRRAYFVLTCAGSCGNAAAYVQKLCARCGLRFYGLAPIIMPENYLALFQTPDEQECQAIIARALPQIDALARQIATGNPLPQQKVSWRDRLLSGPINPLFYSIYAHDQGLRATEQCVACGLCAKRCPLNNIVLTDGRPVWQGSCTHCMACIAGCPTQAILYKKHSHERYHHFILNDAPSAGEEERP